MIKVSTGYRVELLRAEDSIAKTRERPAGLSIAISRSLSTGDVALWRGKVLFWRYVCVQVKA